MIRFAFGMGCSRCGRSAGSALRRCLGFASQWGFGRVDVCNLFAYRATKPAALRLAVDPIGPKNHEYLVEAATGCNLVVAAWGNVGHGSDQSARVLATL